MKLQHIQQRNGRFVWRLNICGEALRNIDETGKELSYATPAGAAYACDMAKFFIREKYGVRSSKTELSLTPESFVERAEREGVNLADLHAVFEAMPWRMQEFIKDAGPFLEEQGKRDAARAAVPVVNADYFTTLLTALPKRLIDGLSVLRKAKQLNGLTVEKTAALALLESQLEAFEAQTRASIAKILE